MREYKTFGKASQGKLNTCENTAYAFGHYPAACGPYGDVDKERQAEEGCEDANQCRKKITIGAVIGIKGILEAAVNFSMDKSDGNGSGESDHEGNTVSEACSEDSIAIATGIDGKAKGERGSYIVLAEWELKEDGHWHIKDVRSVRVDGERIKENIFYILKDGEFVEYD